PARGGFGRGFEAGRERFNPNAEGMLAPGVRIVHEDEDVLVVNKPTGLVTAAGPEELRETLFDMVKSHVRSRAFRPRSRSKARDLQASEEDAAAEGNKPAGPGKVFAGVIHRLDREASGLLVFSKNERAFHWLKDDFKSKRVHRIYSVLVEGKVGEVGDQGTIQSFLREARDGMVSSIKTDDFRGAGGQQTGMGEEHDQARPAVTHYKVLGVGNGMTLLQVRLETGRKHQIRVHMLERGHAVVGDRRYGAKLDPIKRLGLHAAELGFGHPGNGQSVRFYSDAPESFYRAVGMEPPAPKKNLTGAPSALVKPGKPGAPGLEEDTSWQVVAGWYDKMVEGAGGAGGSGGENGEKRNDHYEQVIIPGTLRLVQPTEGLRVLDVACGQGVVSREMARLGASVVGVDAAADLIDFAIKRNKQAGIAAERAQFHVGDARQIGAMDLGEFDVCTCVMAAANINPLEPLFEGVVKRLKVGGKFVFVITHPAFRAIDQTSWHFDSEKHKQYRRIDGYLSLGQKAVQMHPGSAPDVITWTFHRPLQTYVRLLSAAGLMIDALEEWPAMRVSQPGPRADEENRARREIPLFLAVRAVKSGG
ncbi:MAG: methyltransferase domain-containing protein, partial [Phycisphaerales bacterium]|nr:methyltransferase domain-containing protein [Phycisphaerales bacterium]